MKIVKLIENNDGYTLDSSMYSAYVESVKHLLPESILNFMQADWHYDPNDARCLHDARIQEILIQESPRGDFSSSNVTLTLKRADEKRIKLQYFEVSRYLFEKTKCEWPASEYSHGDLIIDEMLASENGLFTHEIKFTDATLTVQFSSFSISDIY
ncbi:MAG: hypothetical protein RR517_23835 [Pseudomonas sp.]